MLTLASASAIRRTMLEQAGVQFEIVPADIDESAAKHDAANATALAATLAKEKAVSVSRGRAGLVIGSDSVASVDDRIFAKPADRDEAIEHLRFFSGRELVLTSSVALARDGNVEWHWTDNARLNVRQLSDAFIDSYLDAEWPAVSYCVGVFRLEGRGIQLFETIEGSYFTILGMPLLPLLGALREREAIPA